MTSTGLPRAIAAVGAMALLNCQPAAAVDFHDSIDVARGSDTRQRPIVVSFGAAWCGWCRKMAVNTFESPEVEQVADKFLWVKIDVDEQKEVAARYRVRGLPHTVVLDSKGRTIGSVGGYLPPERFVRFLTQSVTTPLPGVDRFDDLLEQLQWSETDDETREIVTELVELVARPDRQGRDDVLRAFRHRKRAVQPVLLDLMSDERLAIRAAAAHSLKHCLEGQLSFDPFADKAMRAVQLADWRKSVGESAAPDDVRK